MHIQQCNASTPYNTAHEHNTCLSDSADEDTSKEGKRYHTTTVDQEQNCGEGREGRKGREGIEGAG